jgi:predicted small metal-binding protein
MAVAFVIRCSLCGLTVQGNTENEVLDKASGHVSERHPEKIDELTLADLRERIEEV